MQREGCAQTLDLRTRFPPVFPFGAVFEEQRPAQRDEGRFEVGIDVQGSGEQRPQQLVARERRHRQRRIARLQDSPRRQAMARPHLGGGGEREILGVDIGRAHQAQQFGSQGGIEA